MSDRLILYPTPLDAIYELHHDQGWKALGTPYVHSDGRRGQACAIPDGTPNGWGCRRIVSAPGKVTSDERGLLMLTDAGAAFFSDDVMLQDASRPLPRLVVRGQFLAQDV